MKTLIKNARIISPGIDMPGAAVEMEGKTITAVYPAGSELPAADKVVDAEGRMLLPGFIDIHSHGAGGCDTCDAKLESLRTIAECKMKEGVTSWLPTTLTLSPKVLEDVCASVAEYMKNQEFAKTPGVHLEGPFINPKCCGAQNPAFVRQPDYDEVANLNAAAVSLTKKDLENAIKYMDKANHQTAEFINNVGVYNFLNGDVQRAIAAFNQAAQMGNEAAKANLQQLQQILNMKKK